MIFTPRVEVQGEPQGFVLGSSRLGDRLASVSDTVEWVDLTDDYTSVVIRRGHVAKGLSGLDTGTVSVSLTRRRDMVDDPEWTSLMQAGRRLRVTSRDTTLVTARIQDYTVTWDTSSDAYVTIVAVDATQALQSVTRYGAVTTRPGYYSDSWPERLVRLARSSPVPFGPLPSPHRSSDVTLGPWSRWGTPPPGAHDAPLDVGPHGKVTNVVGTDGTQPTVTLSPRVAGLQATAEGLTPGVDHWVQFDIENMLDAVAHFTCTVDDQPWGDPVWFNEGDRGFLGGWFTPTSSSAVVKVSTGVARTITDPAAVENYTIHETTFESVEATPYELRNTVYEASLADHLTLAADSVGGYWYVDRAGFVQFSYGESPDPRPFTFTDRDEAGVDYTALEIGYSTEYVVNALDITNHGRHEFGDEAGNADDESLQFTDRRSVAKWGRRPLALDLNLMHFIEARAREIFTARSTLERIARTLTFRAHDHLDTAEALELSQVITVRRAGVDYVVRVNGITHDITPRKWLTTLTLEPVWR